MHALMQHSVLGFVCTTAVCGDRPTPRCGAQHQCFNTKWCRH